MMALPCGATTELNLCWDGRPSYVPVEPNCQSTYKMKAVMFSIFCFVLADACFFQIAVGQVRVVFCVHLKHRIMDLMYVICISVWKIAISPSIWLANCHMISATQARLSNPKNLFNGGLIFFVYRIPREF